MTDPRTRLVADGYDAIADTFAGWRERIVGDHARDWEDDLVARLEDGASVLELGCGAGTPETTRRLAQRFRLTGVDSSREQIERARRAIPEAEFLCADFTDLELPGGWLLVSFGQSDNPGWSGDWLGAPTFFASFPPATNSQLVRAAGFRIERDEIVAFETPDGTDRFQWVSARA